MLLVARGTAVQPYEVTSEDVLWLQRAVEAEGPNPRHVAGVLANGFMWNRSRGSRMTFTDWIRAYAQPVNEAWYESGGKHLAKFAAAESEAERAELARKAHAREYVHSTRTKFSEATRLGVQAALRGAARIPARATDYASPNVPSNRIPLETIPKKRNRLYTREGTEDWEGYSVAGLHGGSFPWAVLALGAGLAVAAYVTWPKESHA